MAKAVRFVWIAALTAVICLSGVKVWNLSAGYMQEAMVKNEMDAYRPPVTDIATPAEKPAVPEKKVPAELPEEETSKESPEVPEVIEVIEKTVNQQIVNLKTDVNEDIVGWLTIPNTRIDYPFVIAQDNEYYLSRDVNKREAKAGSIFMDSRCSPDFSDNNTIVYGHNMKNKSMFGDLALFADETFFNDNPVGTILLENETYVMEIAAYMVIRSNDEIVYNPSANLEQFRDYAIENARNYREAGEWGKVVVLSTCAYEFKDARMVLIGKIVPSI
ncbi:MAG: class B sortase [Oscillospiraceae bacterium]|jgi:sortase B|nr:class B sortase [Oscillospiraceae bacterium]